MITFAVPFYTGVAYLRRALESVRRQTSDDWRLVVCDEGAEDGAEDAVAALADGRARYRRNATRLGLAGNWNRCLEQADSDLVCLLHADDELLPEYAGLVQAAAARDPEAAAFFCDAEIVDGRGRRRWSLPDSVKAWVRPGGADLHLEGESGLAALLRGNFIMCPTLCYRRNRMGDAGRFDPQWSFVPDLDLEARLLMGGRRLVGLRATAYRYRRHGGSQTDALTRGLERFEEEIRFYGDVKEAARARGWLAAARVAQRRTMIKLNLTYRAMRDLAAFRPIAAARKARLLAELLRD